MSQSASKSNPYPSELGTSTAVPHPAEAQIAIPVTSSGRIKADGVQVFYRAAGDPNAPVILLLHRFPTSSPCSAN